MASGDGGLQNITLQDGYKKLLVSYAVGGIQNDMTMISTSAGVNLEQSPLYMGKVDENPTLKVVGPGWNKNFFNVQAGIGENIQTLYKPLIACYSGGSETTNNSVTALSQLVSIDSQISANTTQALENISSGQIVFSVLGTGSSLDASSSTWGGPTIYRNTSSGDIIFRQHGNAPTAEWNFDRLVISNTGVATTVSTFDAQNAVTTLGETNIAGMCEISAGLSVASNANVYLSSADDLVIRSVNDIHLQNAKTVNIAARRDDGSAEVNIDAYTIDSQDFTPVINIGTKNSTQTINHSWDAAANAWVSSSENFNGTETINIGARASNDDNQLTKLTMSNAYVEFSNKSLVKYNQWLAGDGPTFGEGGPLSADSWEVNEAGIYWLYDVSAPSDVAMYWYDGRNDKKREIVAYDYADGVNSRCTAVTVDPGNSTIGETRKYVWKNGSDDYYDIISFQFDETTRYIKHMKINDTTAAYTHATALP